MPPASESGERKAINTDSMLKTLGGVILTISMAFAGFALREAYTLRVDYAALKAEYQANDKEIQRRMTGMEDWLKKISDKLDRLAEARTASRP